MGDMLCNAVLSDNINESSMYVQKIERPVVFFEKMLVH